MKKYKIVVTPRLPDSIVITNATINHLILSWDHIRGRGGLQSVAGVYWANIPASAIRIHDSALFHIVYLNIRSDIQRLDDFDIMVQ